MPAKPLDEWTPFERAVAAPALYLLHRFEPDPAAAPRSVARLFGWKTTRGRGRRAQALRLTSSLLGLPPERAKGRPPIALSASDLLACRRVSRDLLDHLKRTRRQQSHLPQWGDLPPQLSNAIAQALGTADDAWPNVRDRIADDLTRHVLGISQRTLERRLSPQALGRELEWERVKLEVARARILETAGGQSPKPISPAIPATVAGTPEAPAEPPV